jgi:hypothetical protein
LEPKLGGQLRRCGFNKEGTPQTRLSLQANSSKSEHANYWRADKADYRTLVFKKRKLRR